MSASGLSCGTVGSSGTAISSSHTWGRQDYCQGIGMMHADRIGSTILADGKNSDGSDWVVPPTYSQNVDMTDPDQFQGRSMAPPSGIGMLSS